MELVAAIKQYMEQIQGLMQVQGSQIDEVVAGQALEDCRIIAKEARQTVGQFTRVHPHASLRKSLTDHRTRSPAPHFRESDCGNVAKSVGQCMADSNER